MIPTPRTDIMVSGNSDPSSDEYADLADFCRQLERELAEKTAAHAKALEDGRRMDWLELTRSEIDTDGPGFVIYGGDAATGLGGGKSKGAHKTLRAAIDAAISASAPATSGKDGE